MTMSLVTLIISTVTLFQFFLFYSRSFVAVRLPVVSQ
jgi:hypothetical protein